MSGKKGYALSSTELAAVAWWVRLYGGLIEGVGSPGYLPPHLDWNYEWEGLDATDVNVVFTKGPKGEPYCRVTVRVERVEWRDDDGQQIGEFSTFGELDWAVKIEYQTLEGEWKTVELPNGELFADIPNEGRRFKLVPESRCPISFPPATT